MKQLLTLALVLVLVLGWVMPAWGEESSAPGCAVIGADLDEEQINTVYADFGLERGSVTELTLTHEMERQYLQGLVEDELLGSRAISCVYVQLLPAGEGLHIETHHVTVCTESLLLNALTTAGIDDAKIVVTAPFDVSGTAALAGICLAYEALSGNTLSDGSKAVSTQELVTTGGLLETMSQWDAGALVNELKQMLEQTRSMSDEELGRTIRQLAESYGVKLVDSQVQQLIDLCRGLEKLDGTALKEQAGQLQERLDQLQETQQKLSGWWGKWQAFWAGVRDFFARILSLFGVETG